MKTEIAYRGENLTPEDCLADTIDASICIASRGKVRSDDYAQYVRGIRDLRGHIFAEQYSPETAVLTAAKTLCLAASVLFDVPYHLVDDFREFGNEKLADERLIPLRKLRKGNPLAYAYVVKADQILSGSQKS